MMYGRCGWSNSSFLSSWHSFSLECIVEFLHVWHGLGPIECFPSWQFMGMSVSPVPALCSVLSNSLTVHIRRQLFPEYSDAEITCLKRCVNLISRMVFKVSCCMLFWRFHQCIYILLILRTLLILPVIYAACHFMHVRGKHSFCWN